jgi:hypothetical protein
MATPKSVPSAHVRRAISVRRRPAAGQVNSQLRPLRARTGAGPKRRSTDWRTRRGRVGINASASWRCAAAGGACGRGVCFGDRTPGVWAWPLRAVGETPPCPEPALLIAMAVAAPITSRQEAVTADKPRDQRSLVEPSEGWGRACGGGSEVGIPVSWSGGRAGGTGSGRPSRARVQAAASARLAPR